MYYAFNQASLMPEFLVEYSLDTDNLKIDAVLTNVLDVCRSSQLAYPYVTMAEQDVSFN